MLAETTEPIAMLATAVTALIAGTLGGGAWERRRNNRRNNPNPNDYRHTGERKSNSKPGLGPICLEHGQSIRDNEKLIVRLTTLQETGVEQTEDVKKHMAKTNERLEAIEAKLPRPDMLQTGA